MKNVLSLLVICSLTISVSCGLIYLKGLPVSKMAKEMVITQVHSWSNLLDKTYKKQWENAYAIQLSSYGVNNAIQYLKDDLEKSNNVVAGNQNRVSGNRNIILADNSVVKGNNNVILTDYFSTDKMDKNGVSNILATWDWIGELDKINQIKHNLHKVIYPNKFSTQSQ